MSCVVCGQPVPPTSRGVTCGYSCRAKLREQRKTREWRVPKQYPAEVVEQVRRLYVDEGMTVAEVQAAIGSGIKVQRLMENHDIPRRPTIKRDQRGERNDSWRGDAPSYHAAHTRVVSAYGAVQFHACVDCGRSAQEWSYNGGGDIELIDQRQGCTYSPNPADYSPRCRKCHRFHDDQGKRRPNGQFMSREERAS